MTGSDLRTGTQGHGMRGELPPPPPPRELEPSRPTRSGGRRRGLVALAISMAVSLVAAAALLAGGLGPSSPPSTGGPSPARGPLGTVEQPGSATASTLRGSDVRAIAQRVTPAVVDVNTTLGSLSGSGIAGRAAGTGIVISASGEVLTNNHVIQNATAIRVTLPGRGSYTATVVGADPSADVALLQVHGAGDLSTATLADSSSLVVGQEVVAIGNALGRGGMPRVTAGTITALGRSITAKSDVGGGEHLQGLIQTNASISPGDSGGPLVNSAGQVVGMITAGAQTGSSSTNVAFAIPTNVAVSIVDRIRAGKAGPSVVIGPAGFLGIQVAPGAGVPSGVLVAGVVPNGPAALAGIGPSSVITAVNGKPVRSIEALGEALHSHAPGERVSVTWVDHGATHTATVRLISGPAV